MVLLHTSDSSGTIFVRTDQLDGETDWKVREAVKHTQELGSEGLEHVLRRSWHVLVEPPSDLIYSFKGVFSAEPNLKESLKTSNTLWANMKIASGEVLGVVIYTGKETRIELNNRETEIKFGKTDEEVNTMNKYLFMILGILSAIILVLSGKVIQRDGLVFFMRIFVLFSSIIPISLKVNIDFAKLFYSLVINKDENIKGAVTRNSNIPEELGRIEYLLSDKTGTLTRNIMLFKKLRSMVRNFEEEQFPQMQALLRRHWWADQRAPEGPLRRRGLGREHLRLRHAAGLSALQQRHAHRRRERPHAAGRESRRSVAGQVCGKAGLRAQRPQNLRNRSPGPLRDALALPNPQELPLFFCAQAHGHFAAQPGDEPDPVSAQGRRLDHDDQALGKRKDLRGRGNRGAFARRLPDAGLRVEGAERRGVAQVRGGVQGGRARHAEPRGARGGVRRGPRAAHGARLHHGRGGLAAGKREGLHHAPARGGHQRWGG